MPADERDRNDRNDCNVEGRNSRRSTIMFSWWRDLEDFARKTWRHCSSSDDDDDGTTQRWAVACLGIGWLYFRQYELQLQHRASVLREVRDALREERRHFDKPSSPSFFDFGRGDCTNTGQIKRNKSRTKTLDKSSNGWCFEALMLVLDVAVLSFCAKQLGPAGKRKNTGKQHGKDDKQHDKQHSEDGKQHDKHRDKNLAQLPQMPRIKIDDTASGGGSKSPLIHKPGERYLEVLVHNVSHTDLMISLDAPPLVDITNQRVQDHNNDFYCLARARFSAFESMSERLLKSLLKQYKPNTDGREDGLSDSLLWFPRYERSTEAPRFQVMQDHPQDGERLAAGFKIDSGIRIPSDRIANNLRVRAKDAPRVNSNARDAYFVNAVFFPLLATLLPRWSEQIRDKFGKDSIPTKLKRVLVLVSGVGTPQNDAHGISDNSTQICAHLLKMFVETLYPSIHVVTIHSETNIFRYDENIHFVQRELLPCLHAYRDAHAQGLPYPDEQANSASNEGGSSSSWLLPSSTAPFATDWRSTCQVTLSFADGSPARNHAIQAALRSSYRPAYCHFWQLKTFWHECKLVLGDIELHAFEEMETMPAIAAAGLQQEGEASDSNADKGSNDNLLARVVAEMKDFQHDVQSMLQNNSDNDLHSFWLRKTHKPVLAVLAVLSSSGHIQLHRGTNMEVSMPTGSLCAERNVIGTALAANPSLKRQDLKMIAVLAVPPPPAAADLKSTEGPSSRIEVSPLPPSTAAALENAVLEDKSEAEEEDWILHDVSSRPNSPPLTSKRGHGAIVPPLEESASTSPTRRITLYQGGSRASSTNSLADMHLSDPHRHVKHTVVVRSSKDMNPLQPCGACNEWLKKIAECNPYFQIVTFTDAECTGVYCSPCEK